LTHCALTRPTVATTSTRSRRDGPCSRPSSCLRRQTRRTSVPTGEATLTPIRRPEPKVHRLASMRAGPRVAFVSNCAASRALRPSTSYMKSDATRQQAASREASHAERTAHISRPNRESATRLLELEGPPQTRSDSRSPNRMLENFAFAPRQRLSMHRPFIAMFLPNSMAALFLRDVFGSGKPSAIRPGLTPCCSPHISVRIRTPASAQAQ
jgi:hypothetical protein